MAFVFPLMLLITYVMGGSLPAHAQDDQKTLCNDIKPYDTRIDIHYEAAPPVYDFSKTAKELTQDTTKITEEWIKQNGMEVLWTANDMKTAGLASGGWGIVTRYKMRGKPVDQLGAYACAYFDEIYMELFYRTIIYIPKDYPQNSCKFKVVNKHELSHHETNMAMVDKYVGKLADDVRKMIPYMEGEYVGSHNLKGRYEDMKTGLTDAIKVYLYEAMSEETKERNALIDTPDEYKNTSKLFKFCDIRDAYYRKKAQENAKKQ